MPSSAKQEFPPLLPAGFHPMTVSELGQLCVAKFPLSSTRATIMSGLESFIERLTSSWVVGDLWIDGSFMTEKIDPKDVDIVLRVGAGIFNDGWPEQHAAIQWVNDNQKDTIGCDSYVLFEYHETDGVLFIESEWMRAWYLRQWGFSRDNEYKGIAVISLPGGAV